MSTMTGFSYCSAYFGLSLEKAGGLQGYPVLERLAPAGPCREVPGPVSHAVRLMSQQSALTMPLHKYVVGHACPHSSCRSTASIICELWAVKEGGTSGRCPDVPLLWPH
jgi:hypothetical protein